MTILSISLLLLGWALVLISLPLVAELLVLTTAALLHSGSSKANEEDLGRDATMLRLAVIVPAHNEEALVGRCVRSILISQPKCVEVLVVAHNCNDRTAAEAELAGARVLILNEASLAGKGCALQHGFSTALEDGFDALLVIDADSVASPKLIEAVRTAFRGGAEALQCRYEIGNAKSHPRTRLMSLAFLGFNVVRPRGRARLGLSAGIFGNGFGLRRQAVEKIPYAAHSTTEDLEYHLMLVSSGIRVAFVDSASVISEVPVSAKGASTQRARWEGGRLRMMKQWSPRLLRGVLGGRARLIEPLLDLLGLSMAYEIVALLIALCLPVAWLRIYAVSAIAVIAMHVLAAAACGPDFRGALKTLLTSPAYIVWKLWMLPRIWRASRADTAWIRTSRDTAL